MHGFCPIRADELAHFNASVDWSNPFVAEAGGAAAEGLPEKWVGGYQFNSVVCEGR